MTRGSILEYVEAIRWWYLSVSSKERGTLLGYINVTTNTLESSIVSRKRPSLPGRQLVVE